MASNSDSGGRLASRVNRPVTCASEHACEREARLGASWGRRLALTVRVHADAFALDPVTYLRAVVWRLRGLKVRSRNAIEPLTGRSSSAYTLWICRTEAKSPPPALTSNPNDILTVIDCRGGDAGADETIASIRASGEASRIVTLGGAVRSGVIRCDRPSDLESLDGDTGVWICPVLAGDRLAPGALQRYAAVAAETDARLIYADDDLVGGGVRIAPHFKPRWNRDLFQHHDFLTGSSILFASRTDLARLPDVGWAEQLVREALRAGEPLQLPHVLHHRQRRPDPVLPERAPHLVFPAPAPLVSVIIPTRDHVGLLRDCVGGVRRATYPSLEIIVIDNDSQDPAALDFLAEIEGEGARVMRMPGAFNYSRINNAAVGAARGDLLCFLNNDVEMIDDDWLSLMVRQALRPEIGAVGARLLYPDRTIQHAGVYLGIGGGAGHGHRFLRADETGYFERARLPQQVSAVTAACLVVKREKFRAVGGFDEVDFPVAFNDVDLCLKLNDRGWQSFYEPRATLTHHESKSRGNDRAKSNKARFAGELAALKRKWQTDVAHDPYHHPQLSRFSEQFLVAV